MSAEQLPTSIPSPADLGRRLDAMHGVEGRRPQSARHLELVTDVQPTDVTEQASELVSLYDKELIPESVPQAQAAIKQLRTQERELRRGVREGKHSVDPDVAAALKDIASRGVGFWRLSSTERADFGNILAAKTPADLSETAQAYLEAADGNLEVIKHEAQKRVKLDDALIEDRSNRDQQQAQTSVRKAGHDSSPKRPAAKAKEAKPATKSEAKTVTEPTEQDSATELQEVLAREERMQRLHLPSRFLEKAGVDADQFVHDAALSAMRRGGHDTTTLETKRTATAEKTKGGTKKSAGGNDGTGKSAEMFTAVDRVDYSNGAQHLYATTSNGERVHISHDKVMEAYGYGGQTQGEREGLMGLYDEIVEQERSNGVKTLYGVDKDGKKHPLKYDTVLEYYGHRGDRQGENAETGDAGAAAEAEPATAREHVAKALGRARTLWNTLQKEAIKAKFGLQEYLKDRTNRRRVIAGGVLGAAAVAVTAGLFVKYGVHHGGGSELVPTPTKHGGKNGGLSDQQILDRLAGNRKGSQLSDKEILQQLTGTNHQKHLSDQQILEQLGTSSPKNGAEFVVHRGDLPWDVLHRAGVPEDQIMGHLDHAAKESGLSYSWHGSGEHRWIEVAGRSDTNSVINSLKPYI